MLIVVLFVTVTFPLSRYAFAPLLSADTDSVSFVFVRLSFRRATSSYLVLFAKKNSLTVSLTNEENKLACLVTENMAKQTRWQQTRHAL